MRSFLDIMAKIAAVNLMMATAASACLPPEPMPRLPKESDEAFEARNKELTSAEDAEGARSAQMTLFAEANSVSIGVVKDSKEITLADLSTGYEATVGPLFPIKGDMPRQAVTIRDNMHTDCGNFGGGSATSAAVGSYVLLFQGVPDYKAATGSVGYYPGEARVPEIIKAFRHFGPPPPPQSPANR